MHNHCDVDEPVQKYDAQQVEKKWQELWDKNAVFKTTIDDVKPKCYVLEMLPYPSGKLHMGHVRNYTLGDVIARFKRMQGYNVLHPMGWDAFGLPAENAARQSGVNPNVWTRNNIKEMRTALKSCGFSYDWDRELTTCDPQYYRHEQEFFIKFFESGLIYQKESLVNWDPVDKTVLANEQVINGKGWRSGALVEKKSMKQWFCKITAFADELLDDIQKLDKWPEGIRTMQKNWIGKSDGAVIKFKLAEYDAFIEVYTTRPDTIFGCSFIGISYDHPILKYIQNTREIDDFISECERDSISEATIETKEKKGIATGLYAIHPFDNDKKVPIYIANFIVSTYGTGAIFGCPAHDVRDNEFAKKYNLPILQVVTNNVGDITHDDIYIGDGMMINSDFINGMTTTDAKSAIISALEQRQQGYAKTCYRLHDWGISRQKYWGCPIPMIYCVNCGTIPVPLEQLPITLPEDIDFSVGGNPIDSHPTWKHITCHKCGGKAERETDTLDTFFESSWYFARYCADDQDVPIDSNAVNYWLPVDHYIGGTEHAVMHLLYARFFTKALRECNYWDLSEPFDMMFAQGMICNMAYKNAEGFWIKPSDIERRGNEYVAKNTGEIIHAVGSEKMSKSKKNGIEPNEYIEKFGADTIRMFVLSDSPPERDLDWNDTAVEGVNRYLQRLHRSVLRWCNDTRNCDVDNNNEDKLLMRMQHRTIASVTSALYNLHINKAIANIRELNNALNISIADGISLKQQGEVLTTIVQLLHPMIPHITDELWQMMENCSNDNNDMLCNVKWPTPDNNLLRDDFVKIVVQVNGRVRSTVEMPRDSSQNDVEGVAQSVATVQKAIGGSKISQVIYVRDRIINLITR